MGLREEALAAFRKREREQKQAQERWQAEQSAAEVRERERIVQDARDTVKRMLGVKTSHRDWKLDRVPAQPAVGSYEMGTPASPEHYEAEMELEGVTLRAVGGGLRANGTYIFSKADFGKILRET